MRTLKNKLKRRQYRLRVYLSKGLQSLKPHALAERELQQLLEQFNALPDAVRTQLQNRVDYYCHPKTPFVADTHFIQSKDFRLKGNHSGYYIDIASLLPYFSADKRFAYAFGDITTVPPRPTLVKSRPINDDNDNSIIFKLDSIRHFYIPKDKQPFSEKKPKLVWRGAAHQQHRIDFLQQYYQHPLCDLRCTAQRSVNQPYHGRYMGIDEQLDYQFILSIEGNDVATNLKWIMASNSLCFMTRPRFETWFMEGTLKPDFHYVLLRDDYSDLDEKLQFYRDNPDKAQAIIDNAQAYVRPFLDSAQEKLVQLLVLKQYFDGQN